MGLCLCGCGNYTKFLQSKYCSGHNSRVRESFISGHKRRVEREIRKCVCGCDQSFECRINSKKRYIHGHNSCKYGSYIKKVSQLCACGCGRMTSLGKKFISGHNMKGVRIKWSEKSKKLVSLLRKEQWQNPEYRKKNKTSTGMKHTDEWKTNHKRFTEGKWQDSDYRKSVLSRKGISSFEQKTINLIKENNLPYKFVGNGEVKIGHCIPDFININGEKKVVEVFWSGYKIKGYGSVENYIKIRTEELKEYGYKVVFLDEKDLRRKDWKEWCVNRIRI